MWWNRRIVVVNSISTSHTWQSSTKHILILHIFPIYNTNLPLLESPSSIKNKRLFSKCMARTQAFVERVKELKLEPKDANIYFDVSALFTSIPVSQALTVVRELLESDNTWKKWHAEDLEVDHVIQSLKFCRLSTTYFVFRERYYQRLDGCAMGSPCAMFFSVDTFCYYSIILNYKVH